MKAILLFLLLSESALAAPSPGANQSLAPWFQSLQDPVTGGSCCGEADCRNYPVRITDDHYEVQFENRWLAVSPEAVLKQTDNPTGDYVSCVNGRHWEEGEIAPKVLCLIKREGM